MENLNYIVKLEAEPKPPLNSARSKGKRVARTPGLALPACK